MVFLLNFARVVFAPLVQPVAADFAVTPASLGIVTSAAWLGSATLRLPTGYALTRVPRDRVVAATGASLVVTTLFTAFSATVTHLAVGAFAMGLSSGAYFIAANPLVSELFPERVGSAIGLHGMAGQLAAVGAPLAVSGVLLLADWRTTFLWLAVVAAAATIYFVRAGRRTALPDAGSADRSLRDAWTSQWRLILTGIAFVGAAGFLWNGLFNLYGDYLTVVKDVDPGTGRLLLSLTFGAGVPAFVITGRLADRLPNVPLLVSIVGTFAIAVLALTVAEGLIAIAVISVLLGYVIHALFPAMDTYMLSSLPDHHRGSAYAVFSATIMFVTAFGSGTVGSAVAHGVGYTRVFRLLAVLVFCVASVLGVLHRLNKLPAGGRPSAVNAR